MATPSAADVIALTETDLATAVVTSIIVDAENISAECRAAASLTDAEETTVLKWLAAHLVASTRDSAVLTSTKLGDGADSFQRAQVGDGIAGTVYGQQAIAMLPCLATLGRAKATVEVV